MQCTFVHHWQKIGHPDGSPHRCLLKVELNNVKEYWSKYTSLENTKVCSDWIRCHIIQIWITNSHLLGFVVQV